jgi:fructose-specific phosphotransferase system IIA component
MEENMSAFGIQIPESLVCVFDADIPKRQALEQLVGAINDAGAVEDVDALARAVHEREAIMSTGIGQGIAIPHVRMEGITAPTVAVGISAGGLDFDTLDNEPVQVVVLFAMPAGSQKEYLGLLAQVMKALKDNSFRDQLTRCNSREEAAAILNAD